MRGEAAKHQSSSCMLLMMESAVVANAATECVKCAERQMTIDHPHLSTFYHVLALMKLPGYIAELNKKAEKDKLKKALTCLSSLWRNS